jgi:hypothetical protein
VGPRATSIRRHPRGDPDGPPPFLAKPGAFGVLGIAEVFRKYEIGTVDVRWESRGPENRLWIEAELIRFLGRRTRLKRIAAAASSKPRTEEVEALEAAGPTE